MNFTGQFIQLVRNISPSRVSEESIKLSSSAIYELQAQSINEITQNFPYLGQLILVVAVYDGMN